jgi:hypothetical protein
MVSKEVTSYGEFLPTKNGAPQTQTVRLVVLSYIKKLSAF